jgi:hypothetical protein
MSKRIAFSGVLFAIALSLSGCAYYGGGYGYPNHPDGYGYYNNYYYNNPYSHRYHRGHDDRYDYNRYQYQNDGY